MADQGHDVYLTNNRGNRFSLGHTEHDINSKEFWDWGLEGFAEDVRKSLLDSAPHAIAELVKLALQRLSCGLRPDAASRSSRITKVSVHDTHSMANLRREVLVTGRAIVHEALLSANVSWPTVRLSISPVRRRAWKPANVTAAASTLKTSASAARPHPTCRPRGVRVARVTVGWAPPAE